MQYKEVAGGICAPKGFAAAGVHCGIRANHSEKYDLALIKADVRCAAAGVYTTNKVCGAPIKVDRAHLTDGYAQAAYVNALSKAENTGKSVAVFYITSKGKLYVRNAGDYLAQMVNIAGGNYVFSDLNTDKTGTQEMGIESFYEKAKDADYVIYVWNLGGKPSTLSDFTGYNSVLSDLKAVKDGNVWCTTPDFFQIADTIGSMINDINLMLNVDADTTELTYLKKLK